MPCWPREHRPRPNLEDARYSPKTFGTSSGIDARAVILDANADLIGVLQGAGARFFDDDGYLGQDPVLLAGVQRIVDGFLEGRQHRFGLRREAHLLQVL